MDGIKRTPIAAPPKPNEAFQQKFSTPYLPKKEELYIPREETINNEKSEKTFLKGQLFRKILWIILIIAALLLIFFTSFFLWKAYSMTKKMNVSAAHTTLAQDMRSIISPIIPSADKHSLRGQDTGRINILLMGAAGENKPGGNLTDTIMVMSIDSKNNKVALLSLPRDLYVSIPDSSSFTKINSLYKIGLTEQKGADLIKQAVENITGIKINYYIAVDFDAFAKIIDDTNGVNIMSERDIYDATFPGPNYSYETFSLTKGAHLLDGATALKYVRERHNDPEGDFGRAKRQQQVIQAVKSKMFSMQTLFNVVALNNILNTLGNNIKTDIPFDDIEPLIALSKIVDTQNITNVVVDAWKPDSLLKVSHIQMGNATAFILVPRVGNYSEIKDLAQNIFNQDELKKRLASIRNEKAQIAIINESGNDQLPNKIQKLLTDKLGMDSVKIISTKTDSISTQTIVQDNTNGNKLFTLDELVKKLPATLSKQTSQKDPTDDIIITLGSDLVDTYKFEEDTMQDLQNADDSQINF